MPNSHNISAPKILTEQDILNHVREVLAEGFGRIEIVIQEHYIHTLYKGIVERGRKPPAPLIPE